MLKSLSKTKGIIVKFHSRICIFFALFSFFLTGCSTFSSPTSEPSLTKASWKERQADLSRIQSWEISGKIAIQTARDSGSANVDWTQNQSQFNISLYGPLGAGGLKLWGHPGAVTMETAKGQRFTASTPEELLRQQMGWNLPVSNLNYWVRGLPVPGSDYQGQYDAYHRLTNLAQNGWNVQFLSYQNAGRVDLPNRITISSASFKTKMVIYDWKI